ncbi:type II secretion system protein D (GspD) [Noviherbaspirillum humi]|uniref:Type IV pilus biogenesis and competence protein PilQ n=1 Tax=Noviherbaspirillum humi TaxID=1688639 RepID=A0A239CGG1_9BURK|nr:type II secretion system secretin GspD [Noviherbaspirillum humi]SNS18433.1 type II secretion system protein D (GspD) [Noviherbaspirillum humi]
MKKQPTPQSGSRAARRHWRATVALLAALSTALPPAAFAQDPSTNQATLNFVGADIEAVVKAIGHYTNTTFIIDPRVKGTINLVSERPVTKAQALSLLASSLRLQGFALVRSEGYTKVVPEADAKLQAGPPVTASSGVRGDQIATQIFRLNYESANNLVPVLRPLISPNNTINANPGNNSIVITDYADNLKRLARIIASLDVPATGDLDVVPVRHAIATDLAASVNRLLDTGTAAAPGAIDASRVSVQADTRTNSLIIRAPSPARASLAKSLIAKLDQPTDLPGNVHVVHLRNADAVKLAQTLRAVVAADASVTGATTTQPGQQPTQPVNVSGAQPGQLGGSTPLNPTQPTNAASALPTGGAAGFIQADPATNTLIITANETVYRNLRAVIDRLDSRRAQVYVESLIVEVSADKAAEFGVQWLGLTGDSNSSYRIGGGTSFSTGGNNLFNLAAAQAAGSTGTATAATLPGNGLNLGIFRQINGRLGLGAIARALETQAGANILSVPNLITLDNEEARIIVGQNVPFITGQYTTAAAGTNPFQTIERRDVGLSLRVRPQISEGGTIKLGIYQETSSIRDTSNTAGIITNKRSIESNVLVDDGQVIVLGGLIEDTAQGGEEKVPGLGDLPVVGGLFKYQNRKQTKTNLMVFLRPTVIRSSEQNTSVMADRYDYIRGVETQAQPANSLVLPNIQAPVLPPLQDGRPVGGAVLNVPPARREGIGEGAINTTTQPVIGTEPAPAQTPLPAPGIPIVPAPAQEPNRNQ